jgi:hypothetical protein
MLHKAHNNLYIHLIQLLERFIFSLYLSPLSSLLLMNAVFLLTRFIVTFLDFLSPVACSPPPPLCPTHTGARARRPSQLGIFAHTRIGAATRFVLSLANAYKASIVKVERHSSLNDNDENSAVTRDWLRSHGADACVFFHFCAHLEFRDFQDSGVASSLVPSLAFVVEPQECQHFRASMAFYWH